nr:hypothetical protein Iba_chr05bCG7430 [Ipomoea batatas]
MSSAICSPRRSQDHSIMVSMPGTLSFIRSTKAAARVSLSRRPSCSSEDRLLDECFVRLRGAFGSALGGLASTGFGAGELASPGAANVCLELLEVSCAPPHSNEAATSSTVWRLSNQSSVSSKASPANRSGRSSEKIHQQQPPKGGERIATPTAIQPASTIFTRREAAGEPNSPPPSLPRHLASP